MLHLVNEELFDDEVDHTVRLTRDVVNRVVKRLSIIRVPNRANIVAQQAMIAASWGRLVS